MGKHRKHKAHIKRGDLHSPQKKPKKLQMGVPPEESGYNVAIPLADHSLSASSTAGVMAGHVYRDLEQLTLTKSCLEVSQACQRFQRLLFIFHEIQHMSLSIAFALIADTYHHMPLREQVTRMLADKDAREPADIGTWVERCVLVVEHKTDAGSECVHREEHPVEATSREFAINLANAAAAVQKLQDDHPKLRCGDVHLRLHMHMRSQSEDHREYENSIRVSPSLFDCLYQLSPLLASTTHYQTDDRTVCYFSFIDLYLQRKETILSTIASHLRIGFRKCLITDSLNLPTVGGANYKSYKECVKIYNLLRDNGLLSPLTDTSVSGPIVLSFHIPIDALKMPVCGECTIQNCTDSSQDNQRATASRSIYFSYAPVVLPPAETVALELDCLDTTKKWRVSQAEALQSELIRKQGALMSAQKRLKNASVLDKVGTSGGYETVLRRLTEGSDFLGGMQYLVWPGAERRVSETPDLDQLAQQIIQSAGPESVRESVQSALLGRYRQDSLL